MWVRFFRDVFLLLGLCARVGRFAACFGFVLVAEVSLPVGAGQASSAEAGFVLGSLWAQLRFEGRCQRRI
jgi:hypothetical protein